MEALPSPLSSRPKRTRISCHASLDKAAYAPFCKGKAHEVHQRHQVPQEIRGSGVEGSAVRPSGFPNSGVLTQTLEPWVSKPAAPIKINLRQYPRARSPDGRV